MNEHAANTSSSRRIASTHLLARGSLALTILVATVAVGIGGLAAPVAAEETTDDGLQMEIGEVNEEYIAVEVAFPGGEGTFDKSSPLLLGRADQFLIHEDGESVSLPEDTEGLARPVEVKRLDEQTYLLYFQTDDLDLSEVEDEEVTLGLGIFTERTIPVEQWDTKFVGFDPRSG